MTFLKKPIKGYEGIYEIHSNGRVWSVKRFNKQNRLCGDLFLSLHDNSSGYKKVILTKNNKSKSFYIHRIVAESFIPNPKNLPCVNHKDGNPSNNNLENLEWCSYSENIKHSFKFLNRKPTMKGNFGKDHNRSKTYLQLDINGNLIKEWYSSYEIQRELGILQQNISKVCKGKRRSAGGFIWKYKATQKF
jgi:hypothetical protein